MAWRVDSQSTACVLIGSRTVAGLHAFRGDHTNLQRNAGKRRRRSARPLPGQSRNPAFEPRQPVPRTARADTAGEPQTHDLDHLRGGHRQEARIVASDIMKWYETYRGLVKPLKKERGKRLAVSRYLPRSWFAQSGGNRSTRPAREGTRADREVLQAWLISRRFRGGSGAARTGRGTRRRSSAGARPRR